MADFPELGNGWRAEQEEVVVKKALFASAVMAALLISATAVISDGELPLQPSLQTLLS